MTKEKIIIDITNESDLYCPYNKSEVSSNLINYIIDTAKYIPVNKEIVLVINKKGNYDVASLIKKGFEKELSKRIKEYRIDNIKQLTYLFLGIILLIIYTFINETVFKEIVLIGGWVMIWATVEFEVFAERRNVLARKLITKLMNSQIIENSEK